MNRPARKKLPLTPMDQARIRTIRALKEAATAPQASVATPQASAPSPTKKGTTPEPFDSPQAVSIPISPSLKDYDIPKLKIEIRLVNPDFAEELLRYNCINRQLREGVADRYSTEMANKAWKVNGEAIQFDPEGMLLNGQHRLRAIIKSGVAVPLLFIYNVPRTNLGTFDQNVPRSAGDVYDLEERAACLEALGHIPEGMRKYGPRMIPNVTLLVQYLTGEHGSKVQKSHRDWLIEAHKEDLIWALDMSYGWSSKFPAYLLSAFIFAHALPKHRAQVEKIAEMYKDGSEVPKLSAAYHIQAMMTPGKKMRYKSAFVKERVRLMGRYLTAIFNECTGVETTRQPTCSKSARPCFEPPWRAVRDRIVASKKKPK